MKRNSHVVKARVIGKGVIVLHLDKGCVDGMRVMIAKDVLLLNHLVLALFEVVEEAVIDRKNLLQGTSIAASRLALRDHCEGVKGL